MVHEFLELLVLASFTVMVPSIPWWAKLDGTFSCDDAVATDSGYWAPFDTGMGGSVHALTVYNGELVAGGDFSTASGAAAEGIAKWTGSAWVSFVGGGVDHGGIAHLIVFRNWLVAAGNFDIIGDVAATNLAKWDGKRWSKLSDLYFYDVSGLAVYNDELIVAGFSSAEDARKNIAKWDGSTWSALGDGLEEIPDAIGVHGGKLYASATLPFPASGDGIWSWEGKTWALFEDDLGDRVFAFGSYDGRLVAAGRFRTIGGVSANSIAAWDGTTWTPLGSGLGTGLGNQHVDVLGDCNGNLWAGGYFEKAGGATASHVACWDGSNWSSPGTGVDNGVSSFTGYQGSLAVAGSFATADSIPVNHIARWTVDTIFENGFD